MGRGGAALWRSARLSRPIYATIPHARIGVTFPFTVPIYPDRWATQAFGVAMGGIGSLSGWSWNMPDWSSSSTGLPDWSGTSSLPDWSSASSLPDWSDDVSAETNFSSDVASAETNQASGLGNILDQAVGDSVLAPTTMEAGAIVDITA